MTEADRERIKKDNLELAGKLEPKRVFRFFAELSAIPRGSGNEGLVAEYMERFAKERGLDYARDAPGNVVIRKPGRESARCAGVILQAHQDMVCIKTAETDHDFTQDPIALWVERLPNGQEWLRAKGTTLGADDGIGVALALAVLDDATLVHPPLEALFTVEEETTMSGARGLEPGFLRGDTLINLDSEDLDLAFISSAAGASVHLHLPLSRQGGARSLVRRVSVDGLLGGHSGMEINKARANAHVLLSRFLADGCGGLEYALHDLAQGQGADNAIPGRAVALVSLNTVEEAELLEALARTWTDTFRHEYRASDPGVRVSIQAEENPELPAALEPPSRTLLLDVVRLFSMGVFRFIQCQELGSVLYKNLLVETSCNLGSVVLEEKRAVLSLLARGSTASVLDDYLSRLQALARIAGGEMEERNRTAGWEMPSEPSRVQRLFEEQGLECLGLHAGLECGCLVQNFMRAGRKLEAVSVGPDLKDVHSPNERLRIRSVRDLQTQLLAVLAAL